MGTVNGERPTSAAPSSGVMRSVDAVLFDMDGTLVDTEATWGEALTALGRHLGGELSPEARDSTVGTSMGTALGILYGDLGVRRESADMRDDGLWVEDAVAGLLDTELVWRPGARELLRTVRLAGVPTALVTTTARRLAAPLLARIDAALGRPAFDVTVCGDEAPALKPDPAPYLQAMAALGVDPAGCVAIEDSPVGVAAALAAGTAVLGVPSMQPLGSASGLTVRTTLAGVGLADLDGVLAARREHVAATVRP